MASKNKERYMKTSKLIAASLLALSLTACGGVGGGGDSSADIPNSGGGTPTNPPATPDQKTGGIWFGTATNTLEPGLVKNAVAFTTDQGEIRLLVETGVQSVGNIEADGDTLSGTSVDYAPLGFVFLNDLPVTTGTFSGTIVERQSLEGEWRSSTGESGDFVFVYDDRHAIPSSLATVDGTYSAYDDFGSPDTSITVTNAGNINGVDIYGCSYGGNIQIIDSNFNMYRLYITVQNCGDVNGAYNGLAAYDPSDNSLSFQVDNSNYIISTEIYKN